MKLPLLTLLFIGTAAHGLENMCEKPVRNTETWYWEDSDITKQNADRSLKAIQQAMNGKSAMGTCELPNALSLIEGYILKQQAIEALNTDDLDEVLKQYYISGYCDFLTHNRVCE